MTEQKTLILALLISVSTVILPLYAQENEDAVGPGNVEQGQQEVAADEELILIDEEDPETPVASNEDFNPSVQISEDLSVSFPVDI